MEQEKSQQEIIKDLKKVPRPEFNPWPTNMEKWIAQTFHDIDADYIPGFDDGEAPAGAQW